MSDLHCDPGFRQLLAQHFTLSMLEAHSGTIYGLWPDLTLAYMNPAWFNFARENQGIPQVTQRWVLGKVITDALPDVLHPFYVELYLNALDNHESESLKHEYECSSPQQYQRFDMHLHNLGAGAGLLIINTEQVRCEHSRTLARPDTQTYLQRDGDYLQGSHCRCDQSHQQLNRWDWIPNWLNASPGEIKHTLCPACFDYYYGIAA